MAATIVLLMCWAAMRIAGDAPIGRLLHRMMVDAPATALARLEPGHVALAVVVTMLVVLHLHAEDGDPIRMAGLIAPDVAVWLAGVEIGAIVEASVAIVAALATLRRAGVAAVIRGSSLRAPLHRKDRAVRARRQPRRQRGSPANDDDEDGAETALAG